MRRSLILEACVVLVFHTALLFSLFLLFAGHNAPGGGFIGGLVAGVAFVMRFLTGGNEEVVRLAPIDPAPLMGVGLLIAGATGITPWFFGDTFLESAKVSVDIPLVGAVKATSALPFDIGVYLVVIGLVLMLLGTLGAEEERA